MRRLFAHLLLTISAIAPAAAVVVDADPSTYAALLPTLAPGDTMQLAAGTYTASLDVTDLHGTPSAWITISGPASGAPALFIANDSANTVEFRTSSYIAVEHLTLDGQHLTNPFGVSAKDGDANLVHDIRIEGCVIRDYDGSQQTDGISTKTTTWGWIIRGNTISSAGTGLYLGNSDGTFPFIAGVIEDNLVENPVGYCMEIKHQFARTAITGMPSGPSVTIIRDNVFIKDDRASPFGDRPNVLLGGFPDSGLGSSDRYDVYGNLFAHNPRESLFQAEGRIAVHDNVFVDVIGTALSLGQQNLPLKLAHIYNNTIYGVGRGIWFRSAATESDGVVGNLVFSAAPLAGAIVNAANNITDSVANAVNYVDQPSLTLGAMDFYPLAGQCTGPALDLSAMSGETAWNADFNGNAKAPFAYRGAYAGSGVNPGWHLDATLKGSSGGGPTNHAPIAHAFSVSTSIDTAIATSLTGSDSDGDALTFRVVSGPNHGTLSGAAPSLTYTPDSRYSGSDAFSFVANDGALDSASVRVAITVSAPGGGGGPPATVAHSAAASSHHGCGAGAFAAGIALSIAAASLSRRRHG